MNSKTPLVSIGLPVYNGAAFLDQALQSILTQSLTDFELIVSDNASTDDTPQIVAAYMQADKRIRYLRNPVNMGAAYNYNRTVEEARGRYFKWAAADDWLAGDFLLECVRALEAHPDAVLAYPRTVFVDGEGHELGRYEDALMLDEDTPLARYRHFHRRFREREKCNAVFGVLPIAALRRTRLIGRFTSSDIILLGELAWLGKIIEIPHYLFYRRDHPGSSVRALKPAERAAWFDPRLGGKRSYVQWRLLEEFVRSLFWLPLTPGERLGGLREVLRWALWRRRLLGIEVFSWGYERVLSLPRPILSLLRFGWRALHPSQRGHLQ